MEAPACWYSLSHSRPSDISTRTPLPSPLPGNYSQSVCSHMASCRLNSGSHLILEVRGPPDMKNRCSLTAVRQLTSTVNVCQRPPCGNNDNRQRLPVCQLWATTAAFEWCPCSMKWLSTPQGRDGNLDSPSSGTIWWNSSSSGHLPTSPI